MRHDTTPTLTAPALAPGALSSPSANTRAAYARALRQFDAWRRAAPATDATLAAYLGGLFEQGRAPTTAALAVAAVTFRATLAGTPVRGPQTDRVLAGFRRDGADRGRGQAAPLRADGLAAILATADRPRVTGRGREAAATATRRGALDKALAAVFFQGGCAAAKRPPSNGATWRPQQRWTPSTGQLIDVAKWNLLRYIPVKMRGAEDDKEETAKPFASL